MCIRDRFQEVSDYEMIPGQGIAGTIDKARCLAGNRKLMETNRIDISVAAGLQEMCIRDRPGSMQCKLPASDAVFGYPEGKK